MAVLAAASPSPSRHDAVVASLNHQLNPKHRMWGPENQTLQAGGEVGSRMETAALASGPVVSAPRLLPKLTPEQSIRHPWRAGAGALHPKLSCPPPNLGKVRLVRSKAAWCCTWAWVVQRGAQNWHLCCVHPGDLAGRCTGSVCYSHCPHRETEAQLEWKAWCWTGRNLLSPGTGLAWQGDKQCPYWLG